jgi:hypothetical protein
MRNATRPANAVKLLQAALAGVLVVWPSLFAGAETVAASESSVISISLLAPAEIPASDARLAADSQSAIARSAAIYGYILDSSYDYKEIACPYAPNDLLLSYESLQPSGTASRFTAIVPRDAGSSNGTQIISISHFGSVPYLPAASNPHTFALFNRVVSAAPVGQAVAQNPQSNPLLVNSLCYLAMIGEPPAALRAPSLDPATVHGPVPTLQFREKGTVSQVITVRNSRDTYQVWTLTFARNGSLLSAERVNHPIDTTPPMMNAVNSAAPVQNIEPAAAIVAAPKATGAPEPAIAATPPAPAAPPTPAVATPVAPSISASASQAASPTAVAAPSATVGNGAVRETGPVANSTVPSAAPTTAATTPNAGVDAIAPNTAPIENSAVPAAPAPANYGRSTSSSASHPSSRSAVSQPAAILAKKAPVPATVVPLPPQQVIRNLPVPPSRMIPDRWLPYPPQAPAK